MLYSILPSFSEDDLDPIPPDRDGVLCIIIGIITYQNSCLLLSLVVFWAVYILFILIKATWVTYNSFCIPSAQPGGGQGNQSDRRTSLRRPCGIVKTVSSVTTDACVPYKSVVLNAEMQIIVKNGGTFTIAKTRPLQDRRSCCARVHTHYNSLWTTTTAAARRFIAISLHQRSYYKNRCNLHLIIYFFMA